MKRASRLTNLPPYPFALWSAEVARARQRGLDVIRLDIGNPDLAPPGVVIDTLCDSAREAAHHGYAGYRGIPALRQAIAAYYARRFGVALDAGSEVVPLIGSKEGIVNLALAMLDPGDLVLVPDPGYAPYAMGTLLAGADVVTFPLLAEHDFLPALEEIPADVADRAVMMWLNYPNNPTGAVADLSFLAKAVAFAHAHNTLICFDAPYADVTYDGYVAPSILEVAGARDVAIEFNSLSKTYNMAGWRMGMAVGNAEVLASLAQVKSNVDSGMFQPLQEAAARALAVDQDWIAERNALYRERLVLLVDSLSELGLGVSMPRAALYAWARVPDGQDAEALARRWLTEAGVAVAPGGFFGPSGHAYVRVSITAPPSRIEEAVDRLKRL
ncbi:MAG: aminotransferase class I/II-fold pyridoxal phosphate-dependent enzyme [Anaerolineae bacterium]|nr:aminotransferase class I/II-fold pyridoxal phosphate-dependent enzyme [Anaerolineae bacterium]